MASRIQDTEEELLQSLGELATQRAVTEVNKLDSHIDYDNRIINTNPISANVGETGWMKFDQKFFVYKNKIQKDGKLELKRSGAIKSNVVINSSSKEQTTTFYQIAGQELSPNLQLEAVNYIGLNLYVGKTLSGLPGNTYRFEYYLSKLFGDVILPDRKARGATALKFYYTGAGNKNVYTIENLQNNYQFRRGSIGFSKDFYPYRLIHISPFLGYGLESVNWDNSPNKVSSNFTELGVNVGVNITHNVQVIGTFNRMKFIKSILLDERREVIDSNYEYDLHFPDRNKKSGFSLGLRYTL